jgi:2-methylisocitrate lyase-like PEP mutase family enzyme
MVRAPQPLVDRARILLAAHHDAAPLVLPNAWDLPSARAVAAAGFRAVATSSRAIADALGEPDNDSSDPDLLFDLVGRMSRAVDVPLTADLQAGVRLEPDELVDRILGAGVAGCNLEDTDHHGPGTLIEVETQAAFLSAVRGAAEARGIHLVINARVDTFVRRVGDEAEQLAEAIRRGRRYLQAGADCVYPIAAADPAAIRDLVAAIPGPVNIVARAGGLTIPQLAELGVQRISMGAGIHQLVMRDLASRLERLAAGDPLAEIWQAG